MIEWITTHWDTIAIIFMAVVWPLTLIIVKLTPTKTDDKFIAQLAHQLREAGVAVTEPEPDETAESEESDNTEGDNDAPEE